MKRYDQAKKDHAYIWETYGPADDMTGAYVDGEKYLQILEAPTRSNAADHYESMISHWMQAGPEDKDSSAPWLDDPRMQEIAERYCETLPRGTSYDW